jgi:hypothetical protein
MAKGEARYRLVLDSKDFTNGLKAAKAEAVAMGNDMAGKLGAAGKVLSAMGPAGQLAAAGIGAVTLAATAAGAAIISAAGSAAKYSDDLLALQEKTGLSTDALQRLEVAAKLGNSSIEAVASATNKMQKGIVDGSESFKKLGLSLRDLKTMAPDEQLKAVAVAIDKIGDPAQRAAARIAVFGKSGNELAGTLSALAHGAGELGGALDSGAIQASGEMADKLDLLQTAAERAWNQLGAAVASSPEVQQAIQDITDALVDLAVWTQKHGPEIKAFFGIVAEGAREGIRLVRELVGWFGKMSPGLGALGGMLGGNVSGWFNDKLKAARQGAGVSSGGVEITRLVGGKMVPDGPGFAGAGDDAAAKAAEKAAAQRLELIRRVRLEEWKTAVETQHKIDELQQKSLLGDIDRAEERTKLREAEQQAREEEEDRQVALEDAKGAAIANRRKIEAAELAEQIQGVSELGGAWQEFGSLVGGVFGSVMNGLGTITSGIGNAWASIQKMKTAGGGFGGMLGKATGALGFASAAFSIGSTVWSGIKSLFGGKSAEEKAAEQQKIKDTITQLQSLMDKAKALKLEMLTKGVSGLGGMFGYLASQTDVSGQRLERLGRFGMELFRQLQREGMSAVDAFKAMGPALDAAIAAWQKSGRDPSGPFAALLDFRKKVNANEPLAGAVGGFNDVVGGTALNKDSIQDVQAELKAMYDDLIKGGFTADQALSMLAPTLARIRDGLKDGRYAVDEFTGGLITAADQGGHLEGLKDPMKELVETQNMMLELWAAIAQMQGVTLPQSLRVFLAEIRNTKRELADMPGAGGIGGKPTDSNTDNLHSGNYQVDWGAGGHPGEAYYGGPPGGSQPISASVTVPLIMNGNEVGRAQVGLMRGNAGGITSATSRYVR